MRQILAIVLLAVAILSFTSCEENSTTPKNNSTPSPSNPAASPNISQAEIDSLKEAVKLCLQNQRDDLQRQKTIQEKALQEKEAKRDGLQKDEEAINDPTLKQEAKKKVNAAQKEVDKLGAEIKANFTAKLDQVDAAINKLGNTK